MDTLYDLYDEILPELRQDVMRRLETALARATDPLMVSAITQEFFAGELAAMRAQLLDIELKLAAAIPKLGRTTEAPMLRPLPHLGEVARYGGGDLINADAPVFTFGFHPVEVQGGASHRWGGLLRVVGLVALIDRTAPLEATVKFLSRIQPDVRITNAYLDGAPIEFRWHDSRLELTLTLPRRSPGDISFLQPTELALEANRTVAAGDVHQGTADTRRLSLAYCGVALNAIP